MINHKKILLLAIFISILSAIILSIPLLLSKNHLRISSASPKKVDIDTSNTTGKETTYQPLNTPNPIQEQKSILIEFCPIKEKNFEISFNFKQDKFVVKLNPTTTENYKEFINWLNKSGFGNIPLDEFIFPNYNK